MTRTSSFAEKREMRYIGRMKVTYMYTKITSGKWGFFDTDQLLSDKHKPRLNIPTVCNFTMEFSPTVKIVGGSNTKEDNNKRNKQKFYYRHKNNYNMNYNNKKKKNNKRKKNRKQQRNVLKSNTIEVKEENEDINETTMVSQTHKPFVCEDIVDNSNNDDRERAMKMNTQLAVYEKMGVFDYLRSLIEVTPTETDLEDPLFKTFFAQLQADDARYNVPDPDFAARKQHPMENLMVFMSQDGQARMYKIVFGFTIFVDMKRKFIRANGHCWAEHKITNEWHDPSPLTDDNEPTRRQYLVKCSKLFNSEERVNCMISPRDFTLGAIINRAIIPEVLQKCLLINAIYEAINIRAEELRLVSCTKIMESQTVGHGKQQTQCEANVLVNISSNSFSYLNKR